MESPLPPDPYEALNLPKDADAAAIKSTYRKLVLKCHPDKVTDEALKQQKAEEFHRIQQAYEILSDETRRNRYDAQVKLAELRKEALERGSSGPRAAYPHRPSAPTTSASYSSPRPTRVYEERKPNFVDEFDDPRYTSKKASEQARRRSPPRARSPERARAREPEKSRSERVRTRESGVRDERSRKYSDEDERARYEADYRRRDDHERARKTSYQEPEFTDDRARKLHEIMSEAKSYQSVSRQTIPEESRPAYHRTNSTRDAYQHADVRRSSAPRPRVPEAARSPTSSRETRRGSTEEYSDRERRPPTFKTASSSPPNVSRSAPQRTYSTMSDVDDREEHTSHPSLSRSTTMPSVSARPTSPPPSRRKDTVPVKFSGLRNSESAAPHDSGYSSPGTPDAATYAHHPSTPVTVHPQVRPSTKHTTSYRYAPGAAGVTPLTTEPSSAHEYHKGYPTEIREPGKDRRARSPSPIRETRPPLTRAGPTTSSRYPTAQARGTYSHAAPPTRSNRSPDYERERERDRDRDRERERGSDRPRDRERDRARERDTPRSERERLYGEIGSDYTRTKESGYRGGEIRTAKRYGMEDVSFSAGRRSGRDDVSDNYASRPGMSRSATSAY